MSVEGFKCMRCTARRSAFPTEILLQQTAGLLENSTKARQPGFLQVALYKAGPQFWKKSLRIRCIRKGNAVASPDLMQA